ncbi:hypothetical protein Q4I28_006783 [Leishmania naiffi]|uniref:Uncharacterized protein n=1 Tax=Leishmania naiffi TaxID=5678 RepID=A0AAW3BDM0_9TRYP
MLCTRNTRLQAQFDELNAQEELTAQLDREQTRHPQELEHALASPSTLSPGTSRAFGDQAQLPDAMLDSALRKLYVRIMERRGLLQHLRDVSADRLRFLQALFTKCLLFMAAEPEGNGISHSSSSAPDSMVVITDKSELPT